MKTIQRRKGIKDRKLYKGKLLEFWGFLVSYSFLGLSGLSYPCCPPRLGLSDTLGVTSSISTPVSSVLTNTPSTIQNSENDEKIVKSDRDVLFTASVAELRRKAQEHSAALWQSLQEIQGNSLTTSPSIPEITLPSIPEPVQNIEKISLEDKPLL